MLHLVAGMFFSRGFGLGYEGPYIFLIGRGVCMILSLVLGKLVKLDGGLFVSIVFSFYVDRFIGIKEVSPHVCWLGLVLRL